MLQEIEEMATELPGATLAAAARRLAMLAAASGAQGGHDLTNLPVLELTYDAGAAADEQHNEQADDAHSVAASAGSLDADAHADADGAGDGGWFDDERLWFGGPLPVLPGAFAVAAPADVYDAAADDDDGDDAAKLAKLEKKLKKATKAGEDDEADRLQTKVDKLKRKLAKSDAAAASEAEPPKKKKKKDKKA
jgi:hypothetical protein